MKYSAVIDTNVILSGIWSRNRLSPPVVILNELVGGRIVPLYCEEIFQEYDDVLHREIFHLPQSDIQTVFRAIQKYGVIVKPVMTNEVFPDPDDRVFYEVAWARQDIYAYLVTGNLRHYPAKDFVISPAKMVEKFGENGME